VTDFRDYGAKSLDLLLKTLVQRGIKTLPSVPFCSHLEIPPTARPPGISASGINSLSGLLLNYPATSRFKLEKDPPTPPRDSVEFSGRFLWLGSEWKQSTFQEIEVDAHLLVVP